MIANAIIAAGEALPVQPPIRLTDDQVQTQVGRLLNQSETIFPAPEHERLAAYQRLAMVGCPRVCLTPSMAVEQGAGAAPAPAPMGYYSFVVRNVGADGQRWFINSETDYRDQRNVSLALSVRARAQLERLFGEIALEEALIGRTIVVRGQPQRVRIDFRGNGQRTGLYYYQTHIRVFEIGQLTRPVA
jgi:hypothetical protein